MVYNDTPQYIDRQTVVSMYDVITSINDFTGVSDCNPVDVFLYSYPYNCTLVVSILSFKYGFRTALPSNRSTSRPKRFSSAYFKSNLAVLEAGIFEMQSVKTVFCCNLLIINKAYLLHNCATFHIFAV